MTDENLFSDWHQESNLCYKIEEPDGLQNQQIPSREHMITLNQMFTDDRIENMEQGSGTSIFETKRQDQSRFNNSFVCFESLDEQDMQQLSNSSQEKQQEIESDQESKNQEEKSSKKSIRDKKTPLKNDYQKNAPNFITKSCIREFINSKNQHKIDKMCKRYAITYQEMIDKAKRWRKIQAIGLGDLHDILWLSQEPGFIFKSFFKQFLRKQYMLILLKKGRMEKKDVYIASKNILLQLAAMNGPLKK